MAARLFVEIGAKVGEFQKALGRIERQTAKFSRKMDGLGRNLTQAITLPLGAAAGASLTAFAGFERLEKGLLAVMGDAKLAAAEMERLKQSATLPGLGFEEAVKGSIRLQAVGLSADEARKTLETFGTAIAATGGNAQNLDSVQYQLTQMISKNRILQEDFGILQENVPLLGKALEAAFGTTNLDAIRATGISAQEFNRRIVDTLSTLPELQNVTGGLGNAFDNFRDSVKFSLVELGRAITESIDLEGIMNKLAGAVQKVVDWFKSLNPETRKTILIITAIVAAIGPLLFIIGKLASLIPVITTALTFLVSPVGLVVAGIAALAAAFIYAYNSSEKFRRIVNGVIEVIKELADIARESLRAVVDGFTALKEGRFRDAAKSFGEALVKSNPVSAAFTQGQRLGGAFVEGYMSEAEKIKVPEAVSSFLNGGTVPKTGGAPTLDLSGEPKKFKFVESYSQALQRVISNTEITGKAIKREFSGITEAAAQLAAKTRPALQSFEIMPNGLIQAREELQLLGDKMTAIGAEPSDILNAKIDALKQKIQEAVEKFGLLSPQVQRLQEDLKKLEEQRESLDGLSDAMQEMAGLVGGVLNQAFEEFFTTVLEGGKNAFASFTKALLDGLKKVIAQMLATLATAVALAAVFSVFTGGSFSALFGGFLQGRTGGGIFGALFKLPGYAEGGIVPPGYPNDSYLARLTSNEAIIPLSKLNQFTGPAVIGGEFTIRGTDLVLAVERNQNQRRRSRGI